MVTAKINDNKYEVKVYDWVVLHDDYVCGHVMRQPDADEESDLRYWMFYPVNGSVPLNCGTLKDLATFVSNLNRGGE